MKNLKQILGFCGACIAFYIGAGFATMQEVMQYEASYGSLFGVVILVAAAIYVYTNISFTNNGNRLGLTRGGDIYQAYCGKWIGLAFDYFSALFCYMSFIVMCGGANSTCMEQWGFPNGVGALILAVAAIATVVFGLNGVVKALKVVGPIIIVLIVFIACWTAITGLGNFHEGLAAVDSGKYEITQVGDGNPFASGASYGGFVILWFAAFLAEIGAKNSVKNVNRGMLLSTLAIFGVAAICCVALIGHIDTTWNAGVPALVLAKSIHPVFAAIYAFIIFLGIYSSACPLLWTGISRVAKNGTKSYKIWAIVLGALGCVIACYVPYRPLLNVIYGLNGYLGFILVAFMIVNDVKVYVNNKKMRTMDRADIELKKHKFILLCYDHYNPLGIIRSLGEKGLRPIVILITNGNKPRILHLSRYISKCHKVVSVTEGLELLINEYSKEKYKPFVYSSSDDVASIIDLNYERLIDRFYFFHGIRQGVITEYLNKKTLNELAVRYGCNVLKNEKVKRGVLPQDLRYPVITKAISPTLYAWKGDMHICNSEEELAEAFKTIRSEEVLVQEFIEKKNELCIDGFAYNDGKNVEMPYYTNYLRFTGLSYGGAMVMRPFAPNDDVYKKVSAMLAEIGFTGIFEVEFLLDKDDTPYFLEINLRNSTWSYAYTFGGYNMPYLWAKGTISGDLDLSDIEPMKEFYALSESDDYQQEIIEHKKSFIPWFRSILNYDCYYYWNSKDPIPSLRYWIPLFLRNIFK